MATFYSVVVILMAVVGITLVLFGAYKLFTSQAYAKISLSIGMGFLLVFAGKVTELKFKGVEIKKDVEQASNDADTIRAIKERVERQSATIDTAFYNAQNALTTSEQATNRVRELDSVLREARTAITNINEQLEFSSLIVRAGNYDKQAFFRLSRCNKQEEVAIAQKVLHTVIQSTIERCEALQGLYSPKWDIIGVNPDKESYEELLAHCKQEENWNDVKSNTSTKLYIIKNVFENTRFTESQRFAFVAECLRTEDNLIVIEGACELLDRQRHSHRTFTDVDGYLQWYEKNKAGFKTSL